MAHLGQRNSLPIVREAPPGFYLDGGALGEILLPGRYIPRGAKPGDPIEVFVYRDSEDRLVATTETPLATVDEFAFLRVVALTPGIGAFLDWGLEKDLLLPIREQTEKLTANDWVIVHLSLDPQTDRILASRRLDRWLDVTPPAYAEAQPVNLLIEAETPLGYRAIVNHAHRGLLYRADLASPLFVGQQLEAYVRRVRPDGKIDLGLDLVGYRRIAPLTEQIVAALKTKGGCLPYHDRSSPDEIRVAFGVSKKAFKQALGALYRAHRIRLEPRAIRLVKG
jgi:uncharacterized protein